MATTPKEFLASSSSTGQNPSPSAQIRRHNGRPILVGRLPDDFLRVPGSPDEHQYHNGAGNAPEGVPEGVPASGPVSQVQADAQLAWQLQNEFNYERRVRAYSDQYSAQVLLTAVDARLAKNYGTIFQMSTYIRFRVGHIILETQTSNRGGKEPKWNQQIRCNLPRGIDTIWAEIYQECLMTTDEKIAEGQFHIPPESLQFTETEREKTIEVSVPLSGRQGPEKEGTLQLVITFRDIHSPDPNLGAIPRAVPVYHPQVNSRYRPFYPYTTVQPPMYSAAPVAYAPPGVMIHPGSVTPIVPRQPPVIRDEDIDNLKDMFPKIDRDVIMTELMNNNGNMDATTTALLELNSTTGD